MDLTNVLRIRSNISQVLSQVGVNRPTTLKADARSEAEENGVPQDLLSLPTFSQLNEIHEKKTELLKIESECDLKPLVKGFEKSQHIVCNGAEVFERNASCLEFIHISSQALEHALKDTRVLDALSLPNHLHRKTIDTIEASIWVIQNQRWSALNYQVDWSSLLPKWQEEVSSLVASAKQSEKDLKELEDLKHKLDFVFEKYQYLK